MTAHLRGEIAKCAGCGIEEPEVNYRELLKGYYCAGCARKETMKRRRDAGVFL